MNVDLIKETFFCKTRCETWLSHRCALQAAFLISFCPAQHIYSPSFTSSVVIQSFSENKLRLLSRQWRYGEKIAIACSPSVIRLADACSAGNCSASLRVALNVICTATSGALVGTGWLRFESLLVRGTGRW